MTKKKDRRRRFGAVVKRPREGGGIRWQARWTVDGKRVERTFDKKSEAEACLDEVEKLHIEGKSTVLPTLREAETAHLVSTAPKPTFVAYAKTLHAERLSKTKAEATAELYGHNLAALSEYFGERVVEGVTVPAKRLDEITPTSVEDYRIWRREHRRSPYGTLKTVGNATLNRDVQFLKQVLGRAVADGLLKAHPLRGVPQLKEPRQPRRYLEKLEAALLIEKCTPRFRPVVVTALFTGMRASELKGLTWNDVNLVSGKLALFRRKTGTPDWIDLHPLVVAELTRLSKERPHAEPHDHVFLNRNGAPWEDYRASWNRALKNAKLFGRKGLSFHSLRHTAAVHFMSSGGSLVDLQAQLGHADVATTMIYAAMVNERRRESVLRMDYGPPPEEKPPVPGEESPSEPEKGDRKGDCEVREDSPAWQAKSAA